MLTSLGVNINTCRDKMSFCKLSFVTLKNEKIWINRDISGGKTNFGK